MKQAIPIRFGKESLTERWNVELGIMPGMSKGEALDKFREWREGKRTCERCDEALAKFCPMALICKEAGDVDAARNDNRNGDVEIIELETFRAGIFEARERASLR